jgi:hypothetical protein
MIDIGPSRLSGSITEKNRTQSDRAISGVRCSRSFAMAPRRRRASL